MHCKNDVEINEEDSLTEVVQFSAFHFLNIMERGVSEGRQLKNVFFYGSIKPFNLSFRMWKTEIVPRSVFNIQL